MKEREITQEQIDKFNNHNHDDYEIKEGDRIYVSDSISIKKRMIDRYLSNTFKDVKRVTDISKSTVALGADLLDYHMKYFYFNGSDWNDTDSYTLAYKIPSDFLNYCQRKLSITDFNNYFYVGNYTYMKTGALQILTKKHPELCYSKYIIRQPADTDDYGTILSDLNDIKIYGYEKLIKDSIDYDSKNVKEDAEDINFDSLEMMLRSNSFINVELAIKLMENFDMTPYYSELLCIFLSVNTATQIPLRKYLLKHYIFKDIIKSRSGHDDNNLTYSGLSTLRKGLKILKKNNIDINRDYLTKILLDEK